MKKNNKLQFSFSTSSALILNSFNQINGTTNKSSAIDTFLKISNQAPENATKSDIRSSFSSEQLSKKNSKRIVFKELDDPLEKPLPSFNADNKQKVAHLKLANKKTKGILKKNPKYLIPNDILTEQIKKYEREFFSINRENVATTSTEIDGPLENKENTGIANQEKQKLIESFYFPKENEEKNENKTEFDQEHDKKIDLNTTETFFNHSLANSSLKSININITPNEKNNDEISKHIKKPSQNNVFTSMVSNILSDSPFSKLGNKSLSNDDIQPINDDPSKIPYYQKKNQNIISFSSIDIPPKKSSEMDLFNYDKKQALKTKLQFQADWSFYDEEKKEKQEKSPPKSHQNLSPGLLNISVPLKDDKNVKNNEEKMSARLKEIEALATPVMKEWPQQVNYNFSLNISRDEKIHSRVKEDINKLSNLTFQKIEKKEEEPPINNQENQGQIIKLRFFLSAYSIYAKNEIFFTMINKTIIKHDLANTQWSYYEIPDTTLRTEFFAFASFGNCLIITGGIDPKFGEITKKTYIFNYLEKNFQEKADMNNFRYKHLLFTLGSVIYCIGGCSKGEIGFKSCEKYLIDENKWVDMPSLKMKKNFIKGVSSVINNSIYIMGSNDLENHLIIAIERFDIGRNIWDLINLSNELFISSQCQLLLLNKKNYNDKIFDEILIFDKSEKEGSLIYVSNLINIENCLVEEDLEFKLNPQNYILLFQESFYIFPPESFDKADKLLLKNSFVETINFEFCL